MLMHLLNVHAGFTFSGGFINCILLWRKSTNAILVPLFGLAFADLYYVMFRFLTRKTDPATPDHENESMGTAAPAQQVPTQDPVSAPLPGLPADWAMPMQGRVLPLSAVPDEVFSGGMMGQGFAIEPADGEVRSPITGEVVTLFPTHHAIGLRADNGLEVLVHVGIDTVNLQGEGFTPLVSQGQRVTAGQPILRADLAALRGRVPSLITPVLFTNLDDSQHVELEGEGRVSIR